MTHFYRNIRWDLGQLGAVTIAFPDPMPLAELAELEEVVTLWLRALRRRSAPYYATVINLDQFEHEIDHDQGVRPRCVFGLPRRPITILDLPRVGGTPWCEQHDRSERALS
jgi:hypothetical protein